MKPLTNALVICLTFGFVLTFPGESLLEEIVDNTFPSLLSRAGKVRILLQFTNQDK